MKTNFFFCLAVFAAFSVSCQKEASVPEEGLLCVDLRFDTPEVRSAAAPVPRNPDTTEQPYEKNIRNVDILIFGHDGRLDLLYNAGTSLASKDFSVRIGAKVVWVIINGPDLSSVKRLSDFQTIQTRLDDNTINGPSQGFVMAGSGNCEVTTKGKASCSIEVCRFVSRIALTRVEIALPAAYPNLIIKNVLLANVVANQNLSGTEQPKTWYNKKGRTESGAIIDGFSGRTAACPALTFKHSGTTVSNRSSLPLPTPWFFYGYPNPTAEDPADVSGDFRAQPSRLIVTAEIDGTLYYYPVTLPALERNKAYEVELSIQGLGTDSPDTPPSKGSFNTQIKIASWEEGAILNKII